MLIDMLTHELRNPLASISFAVGSLEDEWGGSQERPERRLRNIQRAIENMDSVIERCSLMNLMDQESAVVQRAPLDLSAFVLAFVKAHAGCARIDLELPPGGSPLNSDSQLLRIVLSNLLENAVKYSPPGSRIRLRLGRETQAGGQQVIVLSMTNAIAPGGAPDPGQVFERFYRHPLAQAQSGSGLGLYLVRAICRWLGGEVGYRRVSEQEVAFDLRLPA